MRPLSLEALFRASFSEVPPPTSSSEPDGSVPTPRKHSGRKGGCADVKKYPHDASSGYSARGHTSL